MKLKSAALVFTLTFFLAVSGRAQSACDHISLEWLNAQVPLPKDVRIVQSTEKMGICEVVLAMDGSLVATYAGKDWLLAGQLFSGGGSVTRKTMDSLADVAAQERELAKEKEALAEERRRLFFKENAGQLSDLVSLTFGPKSATGFIYVVSDPDCSHCKKLLPKLEEAAFEAKVTLKLVIYPILGSKSRDMAARAICEGYGWEAYQTVTPPQSPVSCERADERIEKTMALMRSANVSFVPMVVAPDGAWVVEGNDICAVRTLLGLKNEAEDGEAGSGCAAPDSQ